MAKILLSFSSHVYDDGAFKIGVFYEGLIKAFEEEGHEVMVINGADFLHMSWNNLSNALPSYFDKERVISAVKFFNPDLVYAFNHCIPIEVEEASNCPIILIDSDAINFFSDRDYMRRHLDRYTFFCYSVLGCKNAIKFGAKANQVHHIRAATHISKEDIPIKQNISFIGSSFFMPGSFQTLLSNEDIPTVNKLAHNLLGKFYDDTDGIFKTSGIEDIANKIPKDVLLSLSSAQSRTTVLNSLQDLGLSIWGTRDWIEVASYLPFLALSFIDKKVYSQKHNQDIYNSSKLCISIAHSQTIDGFPFRIMDVMASNGCLVTDYHSGLVEVTKDYVDLPMFKDPYDARELCKELLKDEKRREEIIQGSQKCIDETCRWHHRFKEMEEILGVQLTGLKEKPVPDEKVIPTIYLKKESYVHPLYAFIRIFVAIFLFIMPHELVRIVYTFVNKVFGFRVDQQTITGAKIESENIKTALNRFLTSWRSSRQDKK